MKKDLWRKIIIIAIIVLGVAFIFIDLHKITKERIEFVQNEKFYTDEDVDTLEYILKEYYSNDYSDEELKKAIIYDMKESNYAYLVDYSREYEKDGVSKYIEDLITNIKTDRNLYQEDTYYNEQLIKQGDYHKLATLLLEGYNNTMIDNEIADFYEENDTIFEIVIVTVFVIIYAYIILRYTFLNKTDKVSYIKLTTEYLIKLFVVFISNIIVVYAFEKAISNNAYYSVGNVSEFYNYGVLTPIALIVTFVITAIINLLINYKNITIKTKTKKVAIF